MLLDKESYEEIVLRVKIKHQYLCICTLHGYIVTHDQYL